MKDEEEKRTLVTRAGQGPASTKPVVGLMPRMTADWLTMAQTSPNADSEALFRIREYAFCKPDYAQTSLWSSALGGSCETVLERLHNCAAEDGWRFAVESGRLRKWPLTLGAFPARAWRGWTAWPLRLFG